MGDWIVWNGKRHWISHDETVELTNAIVHERDLLAIKNADLEVLIFKHHCPGVEKIFCPICKEHNAKKRKRKPHPVCSKCHSSLIISFGYEEITCPMCGDIA